ncbi:MAG: efflux RND transporter periplasmic adaptor subunit [Cytophagales bacterium]|nr:efflux RND transporter periplasmic adaptor subunit [Cytophagales bacterium]MDW8383651.1 efflux RND transporter periplasmic adaptor subunit [Flammeovirgaceae bacterium]
MKPLYVSLLFSVFLWNCGGKNQIPADLEGKKALLIDYKKQMADLKTKIEQLEADIRAIEKPNPKAGLKLVETQTLVDTTFQHFIDVQGNVESEMNVLVNPEISGILLRKAVKEGQSVKKGQLLAEIDAESIRKNIAELEKSLELAQIAYERQTNLWNQKIGTEMQYLQAKNTKERLEKSLESAKTMLRKASVVSPIDGVVEAFALNVGEMANPAIPLCRIVNLKQVDVVADVSETYAKVVRKGDKVDILFPAIGTKVTAYISMVGQYIKPDNRTFKIEIQIPNPDEYLKPNTLAIVRINDFTQKNAIVVPSNIVQKSTDGTKFVYVVRSEQGNDVVRKINVEVGKSYDEKTHILSGLKVGDKIITKGYTEIVDGEIVNAL